MSIDGKTILLTGGTGSFGTAFARRVRDQHPDTTLRVFSRDELKQSEMRAEFGDDQLRYLVGDIRDRARLTRAAQGADLIIHAAAMKQVPACEYNPSEAIATNVDGSQNIVDAAIDAGVAQVVALSTDKAVNPVNLYGATKLCAEKVIVQGNAYAADSNTRLSCVRYGNVVGSRGSVVPLFREQAKQGRLTITDERMTRFWITLPQAVDLVMFAIEHAIGGEVFIPRLPSTRVTDLADVMAPGLPRDIIGIRPGEKLHEVMLTADESRHTVAVDDVYVVLPEQPWWSNPPRWSDGKPLADEFVYASNTNDWWLSPDEIAALLP
jgi:UDP-N-acetylglucosamine 4,6-dehydratase